MEQPREENNLAVAQRTIRFFEALLGATGDGIVITDVSQNIVLANGAFCAFLGQRPQDVVETNLFDWLGDLDPEGPRKWADIERRVRSDGGCHDTVFQTAAEDTRHLSINASILERVAEEEKGVVISVWRDVTEREKAKEALRRAKDELEQRVEERTKALQHDITERRRVEDMLRRKTAFLGLLQSTAIAANEASTLEEAIQVCLDRVCGLTGWPVGHAYLRSQQGGGELVPADLWYLEDEEAFRTFKEVTMATSFAPGIGLPGRVLAHARPAWIVDVTKDPNFPRARLAQDIGVRAGFAFPVLAGTEVTAVLEFFSTEATQPDEPMLETMAYVGTQLGRVAERQRAEEALRQHAHDLGERVKELTGLYSLSNIFNLSDISLEGAMEMVVEVIPPAWHYPEITCGRITIGDLEFTTKNFEETAWRQASDIVISGKRAGEIEVFYLEETPELDEGPFLKEERDLINQMAERIGEHFERRQIEEQIRRSQKMEAVGQLTGGIAHDFNNILGIVMGNLELLQRMVSGDEKASSRVEKALEGAKRGADLTRKLLRFTRKEAHGTKLTSVNEFICNMEELLVKSLTVAINVEHHLADDLWPVKVDPGDLQNAILNLALNARDAMSDGGSLVIETRNKVLDEDYVRHNPQGKAGEFVMLSVSDTGHGMTPEVRERVLEPFFSTKEEGKGTGLGLNMVDGFAQRSKGHMKIYSEPGEGATIRIYLPRAHEEGESEGKVPAQVNLPRGSETILVVDDEEQLVDIAVPHLEGLGYRTVTANGGKQALEVLQGDADIDLLFSDVIMPGGMDGYELAKQAIEKRPNLKVLLTSGFTKKREELNNGDKAVYAELAANLLSKPYNQSELALSVRRVLDEEG